MTNIDRSKQEELRDVATDDVFKRVNISPLRRQTRLSKNDVHEIHNILTPDIVKKYDSNSFKDLVPRKSKNLIEPLGVGL